MLREKETLASQMLLIRHPSETTLFPPFIRKTSPLRCDQLPLCHVRLPMNAMLHPNDPHSSRSRDRRLRRTLFYFFQSSRGRITKASNNINDKGGDHDHKIFIGIKDKCRVLHNIVTNCAKISLCTYDCNYEFTLALSNL